jgi:hypothetical protein
VPDACQKTAPGPSGWPRVTNSAEVRTSQLGHRPVSSALDEDAAIQWRENAEPHAGRPVIRRHSNNTGVVLETALALTGEGQTAMPGDDAVAAGRRQFLRDRLVAAREDETIEDGDAAMYHYEGDR